MDQGCYSSETKASRIPVRKVIGQQVVEKCTPQVKKENPSKNIWFQDGKPGSGSNKTASKIRMMLESVKRKMAVHKPKDVLDVVEQSSLNRSTSHLSLQNLSQTLEEIKSNVDLLQRRVACELEGHRKRLADYICEDCDSLESSECLFHQMMDMSIKPGGISDDNECHHHLEVNRADRSRSLLRRSNTVNPRSRQSLGSIVGNHSPTSCHQHQSSSGATSHSSLSSATSTCSLRRVHTISHRTRLSLGSNGSRLSPNLFKKDPSSSGATSQSSLSSENSAFSLQRANTINYRTRQSLGNTGNRLSPSHYNKRHSTTAALPLNLVYPHRQGQLEHC